MKKILIAACALVMTGCAADHEVLNKMNPESRHYPVECKGYYTVQTASHAGDYGVRISMVKINRVGEIFVKPEYKPGDGVKFLGGWVSTHHFKRFSCTKTGTPL